MQQSMRIGYLIILFSPLMICCQTNQKQKHILTNSQLLNRIVDKNDTITIDKFIGANGFVDDPVDNLKAVGFIREYHNWSWDEGNGDANYPGFPNNQIKFAPSNPGWSYDEYYGNLKKQGVEVAPCIQGSPSWLNAQNNFPFDDKPLDNPNANSTDPESYYKKSKFMFQFAARYGSQKVPASELALATDQTKVSGLSLIRYIEDWNEQDKTWKGSNAHFSPEEYAAMASADYDGHCNTMNRIPGKYGIKNADPNAKLVMGGLATLDLNYIKKMKAWFENNRRDKKFAIDAINFHIYSFKNPNNLNAGGHPLSPEGANFEDKLAEVVKYRNDFLPNVEVWVSEFGWDTNPNSVLCAPAIGSFDIQDVQGIWLVRAYLAFIAAGVDRAQMYMSRDVDPNDATWFATCGLTGPKGDFTQKKSWYYIYTLKNILTNYIYIGKQFTSDPNISIYKFKNIKTKEGVYAVWANTSKNYVANDVIVNLSPKAANVVEISLMPGSVWGETSNLTIKGHQLHLKVSEKPVFIKTSSIN